MTESQNQALNMIRYSVKARTYLCLETPECDWGVLKPSSNKFKRSKYVGINERCPPTFKLQF